MQEDRPLRPGRYRVSLAVDGVDFHPLILDDPVPLGRQILKKAGINDIDGHSLFLITSEGELRLMPGVFDMQLEQLRERFGDVQTRQLPSGTTLVTVPGVRLQEGWSKSSTTIRFIVPPGYPFAQLDCFWADPDLLLAHGGSPQNSASTPVPETVEPALWFSWHLTGPWNPNRDTLSTWMNVVIDRMRQAQ